MSDSMIEESAARLFGDNVDKKVRESTEEGEFPNALGRARRCSQSFNDDSPQSNPSIRWRAVSGCGASNVGLMRRRRSTAP